MSTATAITTNDFDQEVLKSSVPVLVDFWAVWCGPCKAIAPTVDAVASEFGEKIKVMKVDVDAEPQLAIQYGVQNIPMLLFFKDGEVKDQIVGSQSKQAIVDKLNKLVG